MGFLILCINCHMFHMSRMACEVLVNDKLDRGTITYEYQPTHMCATNQPQWMYAGYCLHGTFYPPVYRLTRWN